MAEPAPCEQTPERKAAQTDTGSIHAAHRPSWDEHPGSDGADIPGTAIPDGEADENLHTEVSQLRRAMRTRPIIDQACGVLMATFGLSPQAAWDVLVTTSQNTNTKLHRLAGDLVGTAQGQPLPRAVRKKLAAAVARANDTPAAPPPEETSPSD